ncbi:MAG: hypothetical protein GPJ21_00450 [Microcystis aeruginosa W13-11]|jgi:hypothetical protein|nr:hypothetical protein [Microcystis aeruginosa W13-11]
MTPKSGVLLLLSCIAAIASVGCVFEISSGEPDLGNTTTGLILAASIPLTALLFWAAVKDTRANYK